MKRLFILCLCLACLCSATAFGAADTGSPRIGDNSASTATIEMRSGITADIALAQGSISKDQNAADIISAASAKGNLLIAVNGGFFNAYYDRTPEDGYGKAARCQVNLVRNGQAINGAAGDQTAIYLGFTQYGKAMIDEVGITLYVEFAGKKLPTWGVNYYYPDEPDSLLLFTPEAGADLPVPANAKAAKIVNGKVTEILTSGKMPCAANTYYFVCGGNLHDRLPAVGETVRFTTEFSKSAWNSVTTAVSCGPWLLHNGWNVFSENAKYSYLADQKISESAVAARTYAAILSNGDLMVGACTASPKQIIAYLLSIGAKDAMLLDGGASSMLYANGKMLRNAGRKLNNVVCIYDSTPAVNVSVGGTAVQWTDAAPFIDANNRTMVPLRAVAEALGLRVSWDGAKREASFTGNRKTLIFPIGSTNARTGDGKAISMDTAAVIVGNRTYAPIRYLAEFFGYSVSWDGTSRTVIIR